jgi:type I pantothenate kinase
VVRRPVPGPAPGAFSNPSSFFNVFAELSDEEAVTTALGYWNEINLPNLRENVAPTRHRAISC